MMHSLEHALRDHELIVLRTIGEWCELDLTGLGKKEAVRLLAESLSRHDMIMELNYLSPEEALAIRALVEEGGQSLVASFERQHGVVRRMGPGRIEREEPWLDPVSPAEALWYRGFLYRSFEEGEEGEIIEYYYLPLELYQQFPESSQSHENRTNEGLPLQTPPDEGNYRIATTEAIDDLTAILGLAQIEAVREEDLGNFLHLLLDANQSRVSLLWTLSWELRLLRPTDSGGKPTRRVIDWLKKSRGQQLVDLLDTWSRSGWNELCHTPGLQCEGSNWANEPLLARATLLDSLPRQPGWYQISDLVASIKENSPDFQRPDGSYDTWYIRDLDSNQFLAGFDSWDLVEGRLLAFLITGPMNWLGLTEIESTNREQRRFRLTQLAHDWLSDIAPASDEVFVPIVVHNDATIAVPFNANRYTRFQIARVCEAEPALPGQPFRYTLSPTSLARAREQGVDAERLLSFLEKSSGRAVPAATRRGIERWSSRGTEARLDRVVLLKVKDAEILEKLRANPHTQPYIAESTGDLSAAVRLEDWQELRRAAASLGLLIDYEPQDPYE